MRHKYNEISARLDQVFQVWRGVRCLSYHLVPFL